MARKTVSSTSGWLAGIDELPLLPHPFLGREREIELVENELKSGLGAPRTVVIRGPGGVGKTTLAVALARRLQDQYPDYIIYLHSSRLTGDSGALVGSLLPQFGVPTDALPPTDSERLALYRSLLHGRRGVFIVDGVTDYRDLNRVLRLAPGGKHSVVIVTTRSKLRVPDHPIQLHLGGLPDHAAVELLRPRKINKAVPEDVLRELAGVASNNPLALWTIRPQLEYGRSPEEIIEAIGRRSLLSEASLGELLAEFYRRLGPKTAYILDIVVRLPTASFSVQCISAAAGRSQRAVSSSVRALEQAGLVARTSRGSMFAVHDAARSLFQQLELETDEVALKAALERAAKWYIEASNSHLAALVSDSSSSKQRAQSASWFRDELLNAIEVAKACARGGIHVPPGPLIRSLLIYVERERLWGEWLTLKELSIAVEQRLGNQPAAIRALHELAEYYLSAGQYDEAALNATEGLRAASVINDTNKADFLRLTSMIAAAQGKDLQALHAAESEIALRLASEGSPDVLSEAFLNAARLHFRVHSYGEAEATATRSVDEAFRAGRLDTTIEASLLLSDIYRVSDRVEEASRAAERALELSRRVEDRRLRSRALYRLGLIAAREGWNDLSAKYFEQLFQVVQGEWLDIGANDLHFASELAQALAENGQRREARLLLRKISAAMSNIREQRVQIEVLRKCAEVYSQLGDFDGARWVLGEALEVAELLNDAQLTAGIQSRLAASEAEIGDLLRARTLYERAIASLRQLERRQELGASLIGFAQLLMREGEQDRALVVSEEAAAIARLIGDSSLERDALRVLIGLYRAQELRSDEDAAQKRLDELTGASR